MDTELVKWNIQAKLDLLEKRIQMNADKLASGRHDKELALMEDIMSSAAASPRNLSDEQWDVLSKLLWVGLARQTTMTVIDLDGGRTLEPDIEMTTLGLCVYKRYLELKGE